MLRAWLRGHPLALYVLIHKYYHAHVWSKLPSLTTANPADSKMVFTMLRSISDAWLPFLKAIRAATGLSFAHFMSSLDIACKTLTPFPAASCINIQFCALLLTHVINWNTGLRIIDKPDDLHRKRSCDAQRANPPLHVKL